MQSSHGKTIIRYVDTADLVAEDNGFSGTLKEITWKVFLKNYSPFYESCAGVKNMKRPFCVF
jgi:hypothetical protein